MSYYGNIGIDLIHHFPQAAIFRSEIMAPFRNTVRFVYGKEGNLEITEKLQVFLLGKSLRRYIQHFCIAAFQIVVYFLYFFFGKGAVEKMRYFIVAAVTAYQVYLVFHECNQR